MSEDRDQTRLPVIVNFALILAGLLGGFVYYLTHFDPQPSFALFAFVIPFAALVVVLVVWAIKRR